MVIAYLQSRRTTFQKGDTMNATPPGFVEDISQAGLDAWTKYLTETAQDRIGAAERFYAARGDTTDTVHLVLDGDNALLGNAIIDWNAYPTRFRRVVGASETERLADARLGGIQIGRLVQEEYLEWRVVRDLSGRVIRIEMTTETMDYWSVYAANDPVNAMARIAAFAGETSVDWRDIFGEGNDPFAPGADKNALADAFRSNFAISRGRLAPTSQYNNGLRALTCMASSFNTLEAAINLAAFGTQPYGPTGDNRPFTGSEMIAAFRSRAAVDCRSSDPTIFGVAVEQAWEGRKLALRDPAGIYIKDVNYDGVLMPESDDPIPKDWFKLTRGKDIEIDDKPASFHQRLTLEVPAGAGFTLGECRFEDDEPVDNGAKLAALVTIALYFRVSKKDTVPTTRLTVDPPTTSNCVDPNDPAYSDVSNTAEAISRELTPQPTDRGFERGGATN